MVRDMFSWSTCFVLSGALGFATSCSGTDQQGHATYFTCQDGKIESMHAPLNKDPKIPEFEDCGDGSCVPAGEECPNPPDKPEPEAKPAAPAG